MKFTRKIVPALALLIVSAVLMTTATFAWFSMNTRVTATGMQMDTEAGDNVLISDSVSDSKAADATFKTALVMTADVAHLRPVSSVDGANFYYVKNSSVVGGNGASAAPSGYELYAKYAQSAGADFNKAYRVPAGTTIKPYTEYEFQVMATNDSDAAKTLVFDRVDLTYGGSSDVQKAFRAAIFVDDITAAAASTETLKSILRVAGAEYYSNSPAQAVNSTTAKGNVDAKLDADAVLGSVPADETKYYKVIVRVWLEGEDTTCTNKTFAKLDETWSLDLGISFANTGSTPPVAAVKNLNSAERSVELPAGYTIGNASVVIDAKTYYPIMNGSDKVAVAGMSNTYLYTTTASGTVADAADFYALTEDTTYGTYHYPINVTPQYSVMPAIDLAAAVVDDTTPVDVGGENYYAITGKTLDGKQLYAKVTTLAADSVIYTIEGGAATDVTVYCTLPAGTP